MQRITVAVVLLVIGIFITANNVTVYGETRIDCGGIWKSVSVDIDSNLFHCGACHVQCQPLLNCCSGLCVNLQSTLDHCGSCAISCPPQHICEHGKCNMIIRPIPNSILFSAINDSTNVVPQTMTSTTTTMLPPPICSTTTVTTITPSALMKI